MELKINCNAFVKLKKFLGISSIRNTVKDYIYENDTLEGKLLIEGEYINSSDLNIEPTPFKEEIPFVVVFKDNDYEIESIKSDNFEYYEVAGRGIETEFEIVVIYNQVNKDEIRKVTETDDETEEEQHEQLIEDNIEERKQLKDDETEDSEQFTDVETETSEVLENETIKSMVTSKIDIILSSKMSDKTDNLPSEEVVLRNLHDQKEIIKVCYYQNDLHLDQLCSKHDISIEKVLNTKRKSSNIRRIIIGID